jgi:hypothetical protein
LLDITGAVTRLTHTQENSERIRDSRASQAVMNDTSESGDTCGEARDEVGSAVECTRKTRKKTNSTDMSACLFYSQVRPKQTKK